MDRLKGALPTVCPTHKHCSHWAKTHLKYCLCGPTDAAALALGFVSIISWSIAEVPQILTIYKQKSTEGLSVAFLLTWVIGDLFNLIGCQLEPATLPTQYYVALLYTVTTMILTGQTIYYGHIYHDKSRKKKIADKILKHHKDTLTKQNLLECEKKSKAANYEANSGGPLMDVHIVSSPIPVASHVIQNCGSQGRDLYYTSARSLSSSPVPAAGSWPAHSRDSERTPLICNQQSVREPLISREVSVTYCPPSNTKNLLSLVPSGVFFVAIFVLHLSMSSRTNAPNNGMVILTGRKLLQDDVNVSSQIGTYLGWAMALIYMGGRLPQIYLNIQRGDVQGLSPFMFLFALTGNATYVGSILVKSLEWSKIRPNLPWLVDAGGCVLLDACILIQFAYFRLQKRNNREDYLS